MIISSDTEKSLDKIWNAFIINTHKKSDLEGKYLNTIKVMYYKLVANTIPSSKNLKYFLWDMKQNKDAHSHHFY
jgi:hypothetical protein